MSDSVWPTEMISLNLLQTDLGRCSRCWKLISNHRWYGCGLWSEQTRNEASKKSTSSSALNNNSNLQHIQQLLFNKEHRVIFFNLWKVCGKCVSSIALINRHSVKLINITPESVQSPYIYIYTLYIIIHTHTHTCVCVCVYIRSLTL